MAALKVITANYMREYDRIKQFCENHQAELKACYDFSQTEKGKDLYEKERQIFELEEKLKDLLWKIQSERLESQFLKSGISSDDLKNLYEYFRKEEQAFNKELKESSKRVVYNQSSYVAHIAEGSFYPRFSLE